MRVKPKTSKKEKKVQEIMSDGGLALSKAQGKLLVGHAKKKPKGEGKGKKTIEEVDPYSMTKEEIAIKSYFIF